MYFFSSAPGDADSTKVTLFSLVLLTKQFDPERYASLTKLLANVYATKLSPLPILQGYLSAFARQELDAGSFGKWSSNDFDLKKAYLFTSIKDVIRMFGTEIIYVWTALLMKKRVFVYCEKIGILLRIIRALPLFVFHRGDWNILRPYSTLSELELEDLRMAGNYVAGFTTSAARQKTDYYDLFVDVNARSITVAEHAKADFAMGSFHKDVATFLVQSGEDEAAKDGAVIMGLNGKTKDLLEKLNSLMVQDGAGGGYITLESLQERNLSPSMIRFLFGVASAEGLAKDTQKTEE